MAVTGHKETTGGFIYFIMPSERVAVKIGWAVDPKKRLMQLQTGCWIKLALVASAPGSLRTERVLHDRFARHRLEGEWFSVTPEINQLIAHIIETGGIPEVYRPEWIIRREQEEILDAAFGPIYDCCPPAIKTWPQ